MKRISPFKLCRSTSFPRQRLLHSLSSIFVDISLMDQYKSGNICLKTTYVNQGIWGRIGTKTSFTHPPSDP